MKQASAYLSESELAQLDRRAESRGISRAKLLHELITEYLESSAGRPRPVSTFEFGGPVSAEERRQIVEDAYAARADRR